MNPIIDCEPWHLIYVAARLPAHYAEEAKTFGCDVQTLAARRAVERGVRFTILSSKGEPKACFGISDTLVPGVGMMWLFRTVDAAPYAKTGYRALKQIVKANEYRRIEAMTSSTCGPCRTFIEWLGFSYEGTKRAFFADGGDMDFFAIVR